MTRLSVCPICKQRLKVYQTEIGEVYYCPVCKLEWIVLKDLKMAPDRKRALVNYIFKLRKPKYNPSKKRIRYEN